MNRILCLGRLLHHHAPSSSRFLPLLYPFVGDSSGTFCPLTPMKPRLILPSLMRRPATNLAVLMPMAKQIPCAGRITAVLTPMTSPREFTKGPPELPGLSAASVWMTLSISRPDVERSDRPSALTTPVVTVH